MNDYEDINQKSNMIIYTTEDGLTKIETTFDEDTVWLSIDQMAELFQRDKSTISRHKKMYFPKASYSESQLLQILQQLRQMGKPIRLTTTILMSSSPSAIV